MLQFPTTADALTPAFLSDVLGKPVMACTSKAIGAGLVGDSARIYIEYADGGSGPSSIAGKFPAADETSRGTAQSMQLYEKEVGFYREIASQIGKRTPEIFFAEHDAESGAFLLLMEDCGPALQGDQLASCTLGQAEAAIHEIAALHGGTFGQEKFLALPFLQPNPQVLAFAAAGYPGASDAFVANYNGQIDDELLALITEIGEHSETLFSANARIGECVIHGDFRLDNVLFDIHGGAEPMVTLDWQTVGLGDPLIDVGYFMGAGIGTELRSVNHAHLLALYRKELIARGGPDLDDIKSAQGYAKGAIHGLTTAVFSAAFVEDNDRSKAIFGSMALGAIELVREIGAMRILEN